jgi:hypothetical protein
MYGTDVGGVRRTRSYIGENTAGVAGELRKSATASTGPVTVKVEATLGTDGAYTLTVEAEGQQATVEKVEADDLSDTIARLIVKVSKSAQAGELKKHREPDSPFRLGGMSTPVGNKQNIRFRAS